VAYPELTMIDIKVCAAGRRGRACVVSRKTGVDRRRARRYIRAAESCSLAQGRELSEGRDRGLRARLRVQSAADRKTAAMEGMMHERDFEGTLVLEQLAEIGRLEDFFDAIDSDDLQRATSLMKKAEIDPSIIAMVVRKMNDGDGEH
jgi:hypothetical protein